MISDIPVLTNVSVLRPFLFSFVHYFFLIDPQRAYTNPFSSLQARCDPSESVYYKGVRALHEVRIKRWMSMSIIGYKFSFVL